MPEQRTAPPPRYIDRTSVTGTGRSGLLLGPGGDGVDEGLGQPLLVVVGGPAPVGGEQFVDLGGDERPDDVAGPVGVEAGAQAAGGGEQSHDAAGADHAFLVG